METPDITTAAAAPAQGLRWVPVVIVLVALVFGYLVTTYVIPRFVPEIGKFYAAGDSDSDGITDDADNCPCIRNVAQNDDDGDGYGNKCDTDHSNNQCPAACCGSGTPSGGGGGGGVSCGYAANVPHNFGYAVLKAEKTELGGEPYHIRSGTYHSNTAGCAPTTESGGVGGTLTGPVTCNGGNDDCFVYHWNPDAGEQCGRYQLDSGAYRDSDGSWIQGAGIGVVLNWGVDCGVTPQTHAECRNNACVSVSGGGADQCSTDVECAPATHLACQNNACVSV